jgi:Protein of unknown function (DUF2853)
LAVVIGKPEEASMSGTATSHDWVTNVKKHVPNADETAIHGIVKHLSIALRNKDSSFVACTDKKERDLVRDHFLKKKLGLALDDAALDQSVVDVCAKMHDDRDKSRVTFYYLLAEHFGKLAMFH